MKVLILAGGYGTRISEETQVIPKPMIEIGGKPILWHIMKAYSHYGFNDFVILCGYKGNIIKKYFFDYFIENSSIEFDVANNSYKILQSRVEPWKVTCLDTGLNSMTGGRVLRAKEIVGDKPFMLTYGDGVANVNLAEVIRDHQQQGKIVTMTCVQPEGRFGYVKINDKGSVVGFDEKNKKDEGWINGGFFVCQPEIFSYLDHGDQTILEQEPLKKLSGQGQMNCYQHTGFWMCMDTLGDKTRLQQMWDSGEARWMVW